LNASGGFSRPMCQVEKSINQQRIHPQQRKRTDQPPSHQQQYLNKTSNSTQEFKQIVCFSFNELFIGAQVDVEREEFVAIWVGDPGAFFVWQETHLDELHDVLVAELDDVVDLVFNDVYHDVHLSKGLLPSTELPRNKI
jgi:hypothetical protein